ncbi:MAG: metallophosphoesterase [Bacteroidales bacterium]|jgi:5'-nucleotidase|nr:metallophosphoesterase [Bacteroidales bacterium]
MGYKKNICRPAAGLLLAVLVFLSGGAGAQDLVILHTNDIHSHMDTITGGKYSGCGGIARRETFIDSVRNVHNNVLLLDAGDFVEGTPYFNIFKGRSDVDVMNAMGYDVACLGNHEFNCGEKGLATIVNRSRFDVVCANYDFSDTPLSKSAIRPYVIVNKGKYRIGVIGILTRLKGLVDDKNIEGLKYLLPYDLINAYATFLKNERGCDLVILLTHVGFSGGDENNPTDDILASHSRNVDIIIGGHSHTFINHPAYIKNESKKEVLVITAGAYGTGIGELDLWL